MVVRYWDLRWGLTTSDCPVLKMARERREIRKARWRLLIQVEARTFHPEGSHGVPDIFCILRNKSRWSLFSFFLSFSPLLYSLLLTSFLSSCSLLFNSSLPLLYSFLFSSLKSIFSSFPSLFLFYLFFLPAILCSKQTSQIHLWKHSSARAAHTDKEKGQHDPTFTARSQDQLSFSWSKNPR